MRSPTIIPIWRGLGWQRPSSLFPVLLGVCMLTGCGSKGAVALTEDQQIAETISSYVEDVKDNPKFLAARFATGAVPKLAELKRYARYSYQAASKAIVEGDQAKMKVKILDQNAKEVGVVEWSLVKEGNEWKLKMAPLP